MSTHASTLIPRLIAALPERLRWTVHNVLAHPLSEVLFQVGAERAADWVHEATLPAEHRDGTPTR